METTGWLHRVCVNRRDWLRAAGVAGVAPFALFGRLPGTTGNVLTAADSDAAEGLSNVLLGYNEFRTNLPGGRWVNIATMRAHLVNADGSHPREIGQELVSEPHVWTQFVGWSPSGEIAIVLRGWNDPENGRWEEENRQFRMTAGKWLVDTCLTNLETGAVTNVTAVDRVSDYNSGLFYLPNGRELGFTALIGEVSKPFLMDLDGRNKRDVSGGSGGFAYGYSASPDGALISYHENYQIHIAAVDGSDKRRIETGNPFNFGPRWSADGEWLLFISGQHGHSNPFVVRRDGTGLRQLADQNGYQGWVLFLDVEDYHQGSSDMPAWGGKEGWVYYTARTTGDATTDIMRVHPDGRREQLTHGPEGALNYQPAPSPDGNWICFGSNRGGTRQLYVMRADGSDLHAVTHVGEGHAALWPAWQPRAM